MAPRSAFCTGGCTIRNADRPDKTIRITAADLARTEAEWQAVESVGELPVEGQAEAKRRVGDLVVERSGVSIDGSEAAPTDRWVDFLSLDAQGVLPRPVPVPEPVDDAWIGVTASYLTDRTPPRPRVEAVEVLEIGSVEAADPVGFAADAAGPSPGRSPISGIGISARTATTPGSPWFRTTAPGRSGRSRSSTNSGCVTCFSSNKGPSAHGERTGRRHGQGPGVAVAAVGVHDSDRRGRFRAGLHRAREPGHRQ